MTLSYLMRPVFAFTAFALTHVQAGTAPDPAQAPPLIDHASRLAGDGSRRVLLLGSGERITFQPMARQTTLSTDFRSADLDMRLRGASGRYHLRDMAGHEWRFVAGVPVERRLDGRAWAPIPASPGATMRGDDDPCPATCDDESQPPSSAFDAGPTVPGATTLDARPASCRSYFSDYPPIERGTRIESGVAVLPDYADFDLMPRSFPSIDFVSDAELVSLTSRDLGAFTYDDTLDPDALFDALLRDGKDIERQVLEPLRTVGHIEHSELGEHVRIEATPARSIVLQLVIRHGLATPGQIAQMQRARRELQRRYGIELRVVEIP